MQCSCDKNGADLKGIKGIKGNNHPFSIEERKWAAEAVADCYKRIENVNAKRLNSEC
ncbi:TPA: hypothetical protein R4X82_004383 [Citrobacter freundii]|nr:hypothetical protein [Citrobacter freundii]